MKFTDKNDRAAIGMGVGLIITTITVLGTAIYTIYKLFSVLNKLSHALDLYISEHDFEEEEDDYYDEKDDGYINCECCPDDAE